MGPWGPLPKLSLSIGADRELESERPLVIQRIINEVTSNVIFDVAGFLVFIDLAGKITHNVNRKARNQ